jgi:preprotein translocase subunit SecF
MPSVDAARSSEKQHRIHLVHLKVVWFVLSGLVIVPGLISICTRGLNYGTDFAGGAEIAFVPSTPLPTGVTERGQLSAEIAQATGLNLGAVKIIDMGDKHQILATVAVHDSALIQAEADRLKGQMESALGSRLGTLEQPKGDATFVGPTIGKELTKQALLMLFFGLLAILIYLRQRYNVRMAVGAVAALVHDALVLIGVMSLLRVEINSPFVAAILTVLGFSVHDSIIIFDRIRENMQSRAARHEPYADTVNFALWQTMSRSVNTVFTVLLVLTSLLLWGGDSIRGFAIALLVGMISGAYSSIFNASQIVVVWEEALERKKGGLGARAREGLRPVAGPSEARRRAEEQKRAERLAAAEAGVVLANGDDSLGDDQNGGTKPRAQDAKKARAAGVRKSKRRF